MIERVSRPELSPRVYRLVDYATKLGGLAFLVAGLEAGGSTAVGLVLGAIGVALGVTTVFIDSNE